MISCCRSLTPTCTEVGECVTHLFKDTGNVRGATQRKEIDGVIKALQRTARESTDQTEIMNATLMLERLGQPV